MPTDVVKGCLPFLITHLKAQSHVTHTYAAAAIDKILIMKIAGSNNVALVNANDLSPVVNDLLHGLFGAFNLPGIQLFLFTANASRKSNELPFFKGTVLGFFLLHRVFELRHFTSI